MRILSLYEVIRVEPSSRTALRKMYYCRNPLYVRGSPTPHDVGEKEVAEESRIEAQEKRASCCEVCVRCINGLVSRIVASVTCVFSSTFHHVIAVGVSESDLEELKSSEIAATQHELNGSDNTTK